ncbi:putative protein YaaQ [bioreactor metagenome]|uniref:Cyclic di-AMP receptor A n=1 Tax=bioreactor metagenome TaxID=1076179 RepID=A0A645HCR2_9ZZZZ|nr:cyclic-di-AMP receptor [Oscillospiraceae bacterium]
MKLILAVINNDDGPTVSSRLTKEGFQVTKLASTGGFLMSGNSTFISVINDDEVDKAIETIKKYSKRRTQTAPMDFSYSPTTMGSYPIEVTVGGATIFVLNVERCERA